MPEAAAADPDAVVDDDDALDRVFAALSDRTRRNVLRSLIGQPQGSSAGELSQPHGMSLTGFMKHLRVLEDAGLIARTKEGRVVRCEIAPAPLQEAAVWLSRYEQFWTERLDALGRYLYQRKETQSWPSPPPPEAPPETPPREKDPRSASSAATTPKSSRSGTPGRTRRR